MKPDLNMFCFDLFVQNSKSDYISNVKYNETAHWNCCNVCCFFLPIVIQDVLSPKWVTMES